MHVIVSESSSKPMLEIQVKAKTDKYWQTNIETTRPRPVALETRFVLFVSFGWQPGDMPKYWVAPATWVRRDVYEHHRKYLKAHGGVRPRTPDAMHHSIDPRRLAKWRDRWDLLGCAPDQKGTAR